MEIRFRPLRKYWINLGWRSAFIFAFTIFILLYFESLAMRSVLIVYLLLLFIFNFYLLYRTQINLDAHGLRGWAGLNSIHLEWQEVSLVRLIQEPKKLSSVIFRSNQNQIILPLELFDAEAVWQEIRAHLPADILEPGAEERLAEAEKQRLLKTSLPLGETLIVPMIFWMKPFSWLSILSWGGAIILSVSDRAWMPAIVFSLFFLFSLILIYLFHQTVELTSVKIINRSILGRHAIKWDEIERLTAHSTITYMIFEGAGKRVVLLGASYWGKSIKIKAEQFMQAQLIRYNIRLIDDPSLMFKVLMSNKQAIEETS